MRVLAKRDLNGDGTSTRYAQVPDHADGVAQPCRPRRRAEWNGGERYGDVGDFYYHVMQGAVTGTKPGDSVKVWFDRAPARRATRSRTPRRSSRRTACSSSPPRTTRASRRSTSRTRGPAYLSYYLDALAANGIGADVYDVDANGREGAERARRALATTTRSIWYTGDDVITREPGMAAGTASRLANDEMLAVRAYLNEGGRLLYTGKYAGPAVRPGLRVQPRDERAVRSGQRRPDGCQALSDDFLQYYLGAYLYNDDAGTTANGTLYDVVGIDNPFDALSLVVRRPEREQPGPQRLVHRDERHPAGGDSSRSSTSWASAKYVRPGRAVRPAHGHVLRVLEHRGHQLQAPDADDHVPGRRRATSRSGSRATPRPTGTSCSSRPTPSARTTGRRCRTRTGTRARARAERSGPASCPEGWRELHPLLDHYQTLERATARARRRARPESWNAASRRSGGWEQWSVDLGAYAGKQVEVSIAYASDWSIQGLGAFVDDIDRLDRRGRRRSRPASTAGRSTGPAAGQRAELEQLRRARPPAGSPRAPSWRPRTRSTSGFGLEGHLDARRPEHGDGRKSMDYLLR